MSRTAAALLTLAVLVAAMQWAWVKVAAHVDPRGLHGGHRRHVEWLRGNGRLIQVVAGLLAVLAVVAQVEL